jgi:hypothetical protein
MSSEHATERVPLSEIREGDVLQDPKSGSWINVTQTSDDKMSVTHTYSDGREPQSRNIASTTATAARDRFRVRCEPRLSPAKRVIAIAHVTANVTRWLKTAPAVKSPD